MTSRVPLTPDPAQMHIYLNRWADHVDSLEKELSAKEVAHREEVLVLSREIDRLSHDLATRVAPLEQQLQDRDRRIEDLLHQNEGLKVDIDRVRARLAAVLEVALSPRLTIDTLIADAVELVEESKTKFRRSLTTPA